MADYNGWTNYETWAWKLWMDNEQGSQRYADEQARDAYSNAKASKTNTRFEQASLDLSATLKDGAEESKPELEGVWADLLGAALSEVNWYEIAKSLIDGVAEEISEAEEEGEA